MSIIITFFICLSCFIGFMGFLAYILTKKFMRLQPDSESKKEIENLKQKHKLELEKLNNQVEKLSNALLEIEEK